MFFDNNILKKYSIYIVSILCTLILFSMCIFFLKSTIPSLIPQIIIDISLDNKRDNQSYRSEVFINKEFSKSYWVNNAIQGEVLKFDITENNIHYLRFDPVDTSNTVFTIKKIKIVYQNKEIAQFTPQDIMKWQMSAVNIVESSNDGITFISTSNDPILVLELATPIHIYNANYLQKLQISIFDKFKSIQTNFLLVYITLLMFLAILLFLLYDRVKLCSFFVTFFITYFILLINFYYNPINAHNTSNAVGYAAYHNTNKTIYSILHFLIFFMPFIMAFFASYFKKKNIALSASTASADDVYNANNKQNMYSLLLATLFVFMSILFFMPNMGYLKHIFSNVSIDISNWDMANIVTWQYFYNIGLTPFKDFWYCYAGHFLFLGTATSPVLNFLYTSLVYYIIISSLYSIFKNKTFLFALAILSIFAVSNSVGHSMRYVLPFFAVFVSYIAHDTAPIRYLNFTLASFLLFLFEPVAIVYAGIPLFIFLIIKILDNTKAKFVATCIHETKPFYLPVAVITLFSALLAFNGYFKPLLAIYVDFNVASPAFSVPGDFRSWIFFTPTIETLCIWGSPILASLAIYSLIYDKNKRSLYGKLYSLIFLCAFSSIILLTKFFIRPHIANTIIGLLTISGILYIMIILDTYFRQKKYLHYVLTLSCLSTFFLVTFYQHNFLQRIYGALKVVPQNISTSYGFSLPINVKERYQKSLFKADPKYAALAKAITSVPHQSDFLYVLGDAPYVYIATGKKPLFYVEMYNQSSLRTQNKIINALEKTKSLIVYTKAKHGIDGLPIIVRNPVIVDYITTHYVYAAQTDDFIILQPQTTTLLPSLSLWTKLLGNTIDFKYIPRHSIYNKAQPVKLTPLENNWESILQITIKNPSNTLKTLDCSFLVNDVLYSIRLNTVENKHSYSIPVRNIWFLSFAKKYNMPITLIKNEDFDTSILDVENKDTLY